MSYNLLLNSSNVIGTNNNQYKYNFINGGLTVPEGAVMSISQVTLPYSWYNISSALGNNTFSYSVPVYTFSFSATQGSAGTGSATGSVFTVTAITQGSIQVGSILTLNSTAYTVTSFGTGTGGTGTYNVNNSATNVSASFTGTSKVINVTSVSQTTIGSQPAQGTISINTGYSDSFTSITNNFSVTSLGTGTGGVGTYNVSKFNYLTTTTFYGNVTKNVTVTLNDGFYTINDLNNALSASLQANSLYYYNLTNPNAVGYSNPSILYPIQFVLDTVNYTNGIQFQYIQNSSSNVVTAYGTNWLWAYATNNSSQYPIIPQTSTLTIPQQSGNSITSSTYGLGNIIGFTDGNYPPNPVYLNDIAPSSSYNSSIPLAPSLLNAYPIIIYGNSLKTYNYYQISTGALSYTINGASPPFPALGSNVNAVVIRCNLVENNITMPSDILDNFPITSTFGSNINYLPISDNSVKIKSGKFSSVVVSLYDQNLNPLIAQDPNVLISLLIHFPEKK